MRDLKNVGVVCWKVISCFQAIFFLSLFSCFLFSMKSIKVLVSGAAGNIGYAIVPMICSGMVFGEDQPLDLVLLDIESRMPKLQGVYMELMDSAFALVTNVTLSCKPMEAFVGVQYAFMIGGFPRLKDMDRKDLIHKNSSIFVEAGKAIEAVADRNIKVLVVANPANTNALVCMENAPSIPRENFSAMTRLDLNRGRSLIREVASKRLGHDVLINDVKNMIIWGNHSDTQYPDVNNATVEGKPVREVVHDDKYLDDEFVRTVQTRGKAIIEASGSSSICSAAKAACDHMHEWYFGSKEGEFSVMGVVSDGNKMGIPPGLVFSFPVTIKNKTWKIVDNVTLDDRGKSLLNISAQELIEERQAAHSFTAAAS